MRLRIRYGVARDGQSVPPETCHVTDEIARSHGGAAGENLLRDVDATPSAILGEILAPRRQSTHQPGLSGST